MMLQMLHESPLRCGVFKFRLGDAEELFYDREAVPLHSIAFVPRNTLSGLGIEDFECYGEI
jgi:hypothetical protein